MTAIIKLYFTYLDIEMSCTENTKKEISVQLDISMNLCMLFQRRAKDIIHQVSTVLNSSLILQK